MRAPPFLFSTVAFDISKEACKLIGVHLQASFANTAGWRMSLSAFSATQFNKGGSESYYAKSQLIYQATSYLIL
jgi:hypothetical protein